MTTSALVKGLEGLAPAVAIARLVQLRDALASVGDPDALTEIAKAIPLRVARLAPEVSLLLAEIAAALAPYRPTLPADLDRLEPARLRVAWIRVALRREDEDANGLADHLDEGVLLAVLTGWSWSTDTGDPSRLVRRLARARDPRLRALVVEHVEDAVRHLALSGQDAFDGLELLAGANEDDVTIRERALRQLARFWLVGLSPGRRRRRDELLQRALRDPEPRIAAAAVAVARDLSARPLLADLLNDEAPEATKALALEALGPLAEPSDLSSAIALAERDALRFGAPARRFLLEAHRHGVFLREEHLGAVLGLFDAHVGWTAEEVVRVTYIARAALVDALAELPPTDTRWVRRAAVLAHSSAPGAHRVLEDLLDRLEPANVAEHPIAAAAIAAAAASPEMRGEERLLRWLDAIPERVLPALRVKGGALAAERLRQIVLDPFTTRRRRGAVMDVLWTLASDRRALSTELARALPPSESGLLESKYLSTRDSTAAELLHDAATTGAEDVAAIDRLKVFCESGDVRFEADVRRLFREVFRTYVREALEGDFTIKRLLMPELEQLVFRYGRHLVKDGRAVRRWVDPAPETGRDLVLSLVVDWLADPVEPPSDPITVALLETASRHAPDGAYLRAIEPYWRRGGTNVRRAAIEALVAAGQRARGLELSLGRLVADASLDARVLTQALAAVRTLRASWAEPLVRDVLERREMAVKKEAAEALAEIGTGSSVPFLVGWIGRHDNASFRASLLRALEKCAGPATVLVLVDALEVEEEARTRDLLFDALSGRVSEDVVMRLARSSHPAHRALVDACLDGRVGVAGKTAAELAARLHRAKLRPIGEDDDPAKRLRTSGFSPDAAREIVRLRAEQKERVDAAVLPLVRRGLADWIAWAESEASEVDAAAVALILDATDHSHAEHWPSLLTLVERCSASVPGAVVSFFERTLAHATPPLRQRALEIVRALPNAPSVGGLRPWRLRGRLGAVRSVAELERCFAACLEAPNVAAESSALLIEAFSLPRPSPNAEDADPELDPVFEEALTLYRADAPKRDAWIRRVAELRPLDLPPAPRPPKPPKRAPFVPASQADRDALLAKVRDEGAPLQERERAALRLLDWPDAGAESAVLDAYLLGRLDLPADRLPSIARWMTAAPSAAVRSRVLSIAPHLNDAQLRSFVPEWMGAWTQGSELAGVLLSSIEQERLLPFVIAEARAGRLSFARLLRPDHSTGTSPSVALNALVALAAEAAPREVEHLIRPVRPAEEAEPDDTVDPVDPIEGRSLDQLRALLDEKGVEKGLAVRAVHALTRFGERAVDPLARLALDRRAQVRSAALRALRTVASRDRTLEVTAQVLEMETRRDVVLSLMASLGHGRHEPSLPGLLERLTDRDPRIQKGAHAALRAWGRDVIPALRHASRRARPDRRHAFDALIADLD
ncbi:MAG: HEAT repeat domain-containing protein [Labilithrix sp.]|nr:HEAT repeat domain-containing protein [Labilithrix sp.]MCW5811475.1 HEAT repeat domain-containing protein [Labilithrix sp.]